MNNNVTVKLSGIAYPLAWGNLAAFRYRSIPAEFRNLVGPAQLAQFVWASYKGVQLPFATWEHALAAIAELSESDYAALDAAMLSALPAIEGKAETTDNGKPKPELSDAEKKSGSTASELLPAGNSA